jgi:RND family efflux transporter MFP subunit
MKHLFRILMASLMLSALACTHRKTVPKAIRTIRADTVRIYGEQPGVTFPGKVKAATDVDLSFRISGPVAKVYVKEGHHVRKGQVLAEIDSRDYVLQLEAAEAEYRQIKAETERIIALYRNDGVTPNDYDRAVYGLKQITAKYEAHRNALADVKLCAPFDGYVQKCFFEANETVSAGTPVVSMIGTGIPEVEINIPSSDFVRRDRFDSFTCTVDIFPGREFPLELTGITRKANLNQLYVVRLKIKSNDPPLPAPGMATMVRIQYKPGSATLLVIPGNAVFESNSIPHVWIYDSGTHTVSAKGIKIQKMRRNGQAIVSEGLSEGEIVVSAGVHSLKEGERVNVLPPASSTNMGGLL